MLTFLNIPAKGYPMVETIGVVSIGMLLTLAHYLPVIINGLAIVASGVFICQVAASSNVGKAASRARSSAAGLYVALYYFGGCAGSAFPRLFWKQTGWSGCVAIILCMQILTSVIVFYFWRD